jgi:DNA-binding GntR family transcriptional regulator
MPEIEQVLPKYLQIAGYIRDQIVRGDLRPGEEVSSEREIASTWKVARPTAARALETLRLQGFVESRQGSGTYVRQASVVPRARERYERARDLGGMYGRGETVEFLTIATEPAPPNVAEALGLARGSDAIRRTRLLRGSDGRPIELSTSWFDPHLATAAPGLLKPERLVGGTAKYLAGITGRTAAYARDQVAARMATAEECRLLDQDSPSAVLVYRLTVFGADDVPIQCDDATYPPELWAFRQEYPLTQ